MLNFREQYAWLSGRSLLMVKLHPWKSSYMWSSEWESQSSWGWWVILLWSSNRFWRQGLSWSVLCGWEQINCTPGCSLQCVVFYILGSADTSMCRHWKETFIILGLRPTVNERAERELNYDDLYTRTLVVKLPMVKASRNTRHPPTLYNFLKTFNY